MLVLSRKKDQRIMIGDGIVLTIISVRGDVVRVGVEAPKSIPVLREELFIATSKENSGESNGQS